VPAPGSTPAPAPASNSGAGPCPTIRPGADWTCDAATGNWLPPDHPGAKNTSSQQTLATDSGSSFLYLYQSAAGSALTGWVELVPDQAAVNRSDVVRDNVKIGQWSSGPSVGGGRLTFSSRVADPNVPGATNLIVWQATYGMWYLLNSADGMVFTSQALVQWGEVAAKDVPTPGDYDGDGRTDLAVWRPSLATWFVLKSSEGYDAQRNVALAWGESDDVPVPGDYDGDGRTDFAVWRPSLATWFVLRSSTGYDTRQVLAVRWGVTGDLPVRGDYDGDGRADIAVWRPSTSTLLVLKSSEGFSLSQCLAVQWGEGNGGAPCSVTIPATESSTPHLFVLQPVLSPR
jgi:hypothetical protein